MFQIFSRQGAQEILVASMARREEHLTVLMILERECLDLSETIEQLSEKQELLATLMDGKMSLQKVALEEFPRQIFQELARVGGAEDERSTGVVGTQAQVGNIGERKGSSKDATRDGAVRGRRCFFPGPLTGPPLVLARPPWHMTRMKQCPASSLYVSSQVEGKRLVER